MEYYGTLGRACWDRPVLDRLFQAGMTGARLNLSHEGLDRCMERLERDFWPAAQAAGRAHAHLILDLQGPELRVGDLPQPVELTAGEPVRLGPGAIPVPDFVLTHARPGQEISLDDSALLLETELVTSEGVCCRVKRGGVLERRKSIALPGVPLTTPTLTPADLDNLDLAAAAGATHILQPFVRGRQDVDTLRSQLHLRGLDRVKIMAKIENQTGLDHLEEILASADEICIARGDLGNGMPLWLLPETQKHLAARCRAADKPFCLVTQLLWSMEQRPVPTRAEVLDIYNGVLDGASSLMLTGETAAGLYPAEAMEYLTRTARRALLHRK